MELHRVIKKYLLTEKSSQLRDENNAYTFQVDRAANKIEIGRAVARLFKVRVESVRVMNMPAKKKRVGRIVGRKSPWKKAIVTVAKDDRIDIIEGV